jgi:uncharacterized protein (TIGR00251 family)
MATGRPEALVSVRVQPRASREEIVGWQDEALRVRVTAPPVDGEANAAVRRLVARALGVAPSTVALVRGERSRDKVVRVAGMSLAAVRARLAATVTALVLLAATPVAAEHLTLDPAARPQASRPFDADLDMRVEDGGFHIGGRVLGLGRSLGAWLRGRVRERGVTLDGQLHGDRTWNFRLDADGVIPKITIEISPGTL